MRAKQIDAARGGRHRRAGIGREYAQFLLGARGRSGLSGIERLVVSAVVRSGQAERAGELERLTDKLVRLGEIAGTQQRQACIVGDMSRGVQRYVVFRPVVADEGVALVTALGFEVGEYLDRQARFADARTGGKQQVLRASTGEVIFDRCQCRRAGFLDRGSRPSRRGRLDRRDQRGEPIAHRVRARHFAADHSSRVRRPRSRRRPSRPARNNPRRSIARPWPRSGRPHPIRRHRPA